MSCHHTRAHTYIRELIKNSQPIRSRFTSHPMEPLSPTIDERRSFDRLYTFRPPFPSVRHPVFAIKCIVVSFVVAGETPIYLLPLGCLLRSFEYFRQVEFRAAFMGFFHNFPNDVQLREFVRFLFLQRIFVELVANYLRITVPSLITPIFSNRLPQHLQTWLKVRTPQIFHTRNEITTPLKSLKPLARVKAKQPSSLYPYSWYAAIPSMPVLRDTKRVCGSEGGMLWG